MNIGYAAFKLAFEISPIILVDGAASNIHGSMLPIVALTEGANAALNALSLSNSLDLDTFFAHYYPLPGSTLVDNQVGNYPFANQNVAANAIIGQPLAVSMRMICPARGTFGYVSKLATISSLQSTLQQHMQSGGVFTVVTPSFVYTNCLLIRMTDVTSGESTQIQTEWQLDFTQPLLTLQQARQAQNAMLNKITSQTPISGAPSWSNLGNAISQPITLASSTAVDAAKNLTGTSIGNMIGGLIP